MPSPTEFLRLALDPVRLAVLGESVLRPVDLDELAARLDVPRRRVLEAAADLRASGIIDDAYRLDRAVLQEVARDLAPVPAAAAEVTTGLWDPEEAEVLRRFFTGMTLSEIPSGRAKRRIVLERLAQEFEPGVRYDERDVNLLLQSFHPDYAALRRYLVDEGFLTRAAGVYWRTGGRIWMDDRLGDVDSTS
jgi:hypothetical protein